MNERRPPTWQHFDPLDLVRRRQLALAEQQLERSREIGDELAVAKWQDLVRLLAMLTGAPIREQGRPVVAGAARGTQ